MITHESNEELYQILVNDCEFDVSHVPKHGSGNTTAVAEHEGKTYHAAIVWDYSNGVEWTYGDYEWFEVPANTPIACNQCGELPSVAEPVMNIAELYAERLRINSLIEAHEKQAFADLSDDKEVIGYKLKRGNKSRKLVEPEKLVSTLLVQGYTNKDLYDVKMKGIPAIEKLLKEGVQDNTELLKSHIQVTEGKLSLVYTGEQ